MRGPIASQSDGGGLLSGRAGDGVPLKKLPDSGPSLRPQHGTGLVPPGRCSDRVDMQGPAEISAVFPGMKDIQHALGSAEPLALFFPNPPCPTSR